MKTHKSITVLFLILLIFSFNEKIYSQKIIKCKSYNSLFDVIKEGKSASIKKTAWIKEFSLIEKSLITVIPVTYPDSGYKVTFEITDLEKGKRKSNYDTCSVLSFIVGGCTSFGTKYENLINTSCWTIVDSPEDARNGAEYGITYEFDNKYAIDGDLVKEYDKLCKSPKPKPVKKPAVYLYPVTEINVNVKVEVNGHLTLSEPHYNSGWNVNATPSGLIDNKYDYLFYEVNLNKIDLPEEGWVVEYKELEKWFDNYLPQLGLNNNEKDQFKEYWLKNLRKANYYEIKLLENKFLSENMNLIISPEPQTIIRLNFFFKPVFEKTELKTPVITKQERKGFTVVEWGGINDGDLKILP